MTTITAKSKINMRDYDPLDIFSDGGISYPSPGRTTTHFVGTLGNIDIAVEGTGFNTAFEPNIGAVTQVTVFINGKTNAIFKDFALATNTLTAGDADTTIGTIMAGADTVIGSKKGDVLFGFGGSDTINGRGGNDWIEWGGGPDNQATGGGGNDKFVFIGAGFVTITDFHEGDKIGFDHDFFLTFSEEGKLAKGFFHAGKEAKDDNDFIIYDRKTGNLYFDADGDGETVPAALLGKLSHKPTLDAGDFFVS